jgi:hypothetical protein
MVVVGFLTKRSNQRHPRPLTFYKACTDLAFASRFLLGWLWGTFHAHNGGHAEDMMHAHLQTTGHIIYAPHMVEPTKLCVMGAGLSQAMFLSSELWVFFMAFDLLISVSNPFASYARNMRIYHVLTWTIGGASAIVLMSIPDASGTFIGNFCWFSKSFAIRAYETWLLYYAWVVAVTLFTIPVLILVHRRLKHGLKSTLKARARVLQTGWTSLIVFQLYSLVRILLFSLHVLFRHDGSLVVYNSDGAEESAFGFAWVLTISCPGVAGRRGGGFVDFECVERRRQG